MKLYNYIIIIIILFSCSTDDTQVEYNPTPYYIETPNAFPEMNIPFDNPMTFEGVYLGKKLFYDEILSPDNSISCASCHIQNYSFSDPNQYSFGVDQQIGFRHSSALINLGYNDFFHWDGSTSSLEDQISRPLFTHFEMGNLDWTSIITRLSSDQEYVELFFDAFGECEIDSTQVKKAIAQFERTLISSNSRYDKWLRGEVIFTEEELDGLNIFFTERGDCFHCHGGINFMDNIFHNNGLDETFSDLGLYEVTGDPNDIGLFKTPTLRNIEFSAPYMHDGRFVTLDEVIEHYNSGGVYSATIDPLMKYVNSNPFGIPGLTGLVLSEQEKNNLKAFLLTLSDHDFIQNTDFQP